LFTGLLLFVLDTPLLAEGVSGERLFLGEVSELTGADVGAFCGAE
jgi:hypothetical protein